MSVQKEIIYPFTYRVESVQKVIDGDTIDVEIDLGFQIFMKERVRLGGIDTPESRTRDLVEKQYGLLCKARLMELINGAHEIYIRTTISKGKFGRILGQLWVRQVVDDGNGSEDEADWTFEDINVNELLIEEGHAVAYHGQNKDDIAEAHLANRQLLKDRGLVIE